MRALISAIIAIFLLTTAPAFAGVGEDPVTVLPPTTGPAPTAPPVPKTIWQVGDDGTALNLQSRLECPATVGDFHRFQLFVFDSYGTDVDCNYQNAERDVITLYITLRTGMPLPEEYDGAKAALRLHLPEAVPLADAEQTSFPAPEEWSHIIYRLDAAQRTGLWMRRQGGWTVAFRASFADSRSEATFDALKQMNETVERSAGAHIAGCMKLGTIARGGAALTTPSMFPALSVSAVVEEKFLLDNAKSIAPENWCLRQTLAVDNRYYILWANAYDQRAGSIDRITPLAEGNASVLYANADVTWPNTLKDGPKPDAVFDLVLVNPTQVMVVGVYDGRPRIPEMERFLGPGPFAVYAGIDRKDGKVTVYRAPL